MTIARKWLMFWALVMYLAQRSETRCTVGKCPEGWVKFRDHSCVKMFKEVPKTWPEAEVICRQSGRGSYLIKLKDAADSTAFNQLLDLHNFPAYEYAWIGLNDIVQEGVFKWVGDPQVLMSYEDFGFNEPNNAMGLEDCVGSSQYRWNDFRCDIPLKFVCQKPLHYTEN